MRYSIEDLKKKDCVITKDSICFPRQEDKNFEYNIFSNFVRCFPKINDHFCIEYDTVENFYQASKTNIVDIRKEFALVTPSIAKKVGKCIKMISDWDEKKYDIMRKGLFQKFNNNNEFQNLLLSTGNVQIIEFNWWGDYIWGYDAKNKVGANALGKLLMEIRENLKII